MGIKNLVSTFFKKSKIKDNYFLALDIGTEAVKALIFKITPENSKDKALSQPKKKIIILGYDVQYFGQYGVFDGRDFETEVVKKTISKAIEEARKNLFSSLLERKIKDRIENQKKWPVFLGISANTLKGRIVWQVFYRKNIQEKISEKEEEKIFQEVLRKAKKEVSQRFAQKFGILPVDIHWISLKILEMKIDGYFVPKLCGFEGERLEFKILAIFLTKHYWENIKKILENSEVEILGVVHLAQCLPYLCQGEKENGIFIDVGGDVTQFFLVRNGSLQQIGEFAGGGRAFSQALSQNLTIDEETARALKERYSAGTLSIGTTGKIKELLSEEQKNWYLNFKKYFKMFNHKRPFPLNVYLFGGGSLVPEIKEILEEIIFSGSGDLADRELPEIKFIYPKDLKNIENLTIGLENPQSISSSLMCYYAL